MRSTSGLLCSSVSGTSLFQEFVEIKAASWLNFYTDWLKGNPSENILVLHYENIRRNLKCVCTTVHMQLQCMHRNFC